MIICVTSQGNSVESRVDPRFGRCAYFIFADTSTGKFEAIKNPNIEATGGAGPQSAQLVASKGAKKILTGNVGPNAMSTLAAAGIEVVTNVWGSVKEAVDNNK